MEHLTGHVQHYAWGSREALARLQGRACPTPQPEAELWLGAHPSAPSTVQGHTAALNAIIAADPEGWLGPGAARWGTRLPFLVKYLAAAQPLSLQVHPDRDQAAKRWRERHPGYADGHHKPEMLIATEQFEALCGFRDPRTSADTLRSFGLPVLDGLADLVSGGDLRGCVQAALSMDAQAAAAAIDAATRADGAEPAWRELLRSLARRWPADPAVLLSPLLHHVTLRPGEAIWMPAGNLHAYLGGAGVEVMAASDNVLRAGLTGKPVDVAEVVDIVRYEPLDTPLITPERVAAGLGVYRPPVKEFEVWRVDADDTEVPVAGVRIAFSLGHVTVSDEEGTVALGPGQAAVGRGGPCRVRGSGRVFVVCPAR